MSVQCRHWRLAHWQDCTAADMAGGKFHTGSRSAVEVPADAKSAAEQSSVARDTVVVATDLVVDGHCTSAAEPADTAAKAVDM